MFEVTLLHWLVYHCTSQAGSRAASQSAWRTGSGWLAQKEEGNISPFFVAQWAERVFTFDRHESHWKDEIVIIYGVFKKLVFSIQPDTCSPSINSGRKWRADCLNGCGNWQRQDRKRKNSKALCMVQVNIFLINIKWCSEISDKYLNILKKKRLEKFNFLLMPFLLAIIKKSNSRVNHLNLLQSVLLVDVTVMKHFVCIWFNRFTFLTNCVYKLMKSVYLWS